MMRILSRRLAALFLLLAAGPAFAATPAIPPGAPQIGVGSAVVLIAASNAPAAVKAKANVVCPATDCAALIQAAITSLPAAGSVVDGANHTITGGVNGSILFSAGMFNISTALTVPTGSVIRMWGDGASSWIPINAVGSAWPGGTTIYSTDPTGAALAFVKTSYNTPATGVDLRNLDLRIFNPAANVTGTSLVLDGMMTGIVENVNVLGDLTTNATNRIAVGLSLQAGGASSRKIMSGVNVYGFRQTGIVISTTHLTGTNLSAGLISNDAYSAAFSITPDHDQFFAGLQAFSAKYGLSINFGAVPLAIDSIHFEATTNAINFGSGTTNQQARIRRVELDTGVAFSGLITDPRLVIDDITLAASPALLGRTRGVASIASGATTVVVTHGLIAAPSEINLTPQASGSVGAWVSNITATTFTINLPSAPGAAVNVQWSARM